MVVYSSLMHEDVAFFIFLCIENSNYYKRLVWPLLFIILNYFTGSEKNVKKINN